MAAIMYNMQIYPYLEYYNHLHRPRIEHGCAGYRSVWAAMPLGKSRRQKGLLLKIVWKVVPNGDQLQIIGLLGRDIWMGFTKSTEFVGTTKY